MEHAVQPTVCSTKDPIQIMGHAVQAIMSSNKEGRIHLRGLTHLPSHHVQHEECLIQLMEHTVQDAVPAAFRSSAPPRLRPSRQVRAESMKKNGATPQETARKNLIRIFPPYFDPPGK